MVQFVWTHYILVFLYCCCVETPWQQQANRESKTVDSNPELPAGQTFSAAWGGAGFSIFTPSWSPDRPGSGLLCYSAEMQGSLSLVLQLVRGRASSPTCHRQQRGLCPLPQATLWKMQGMATSYLCPCQKGHTMHLCEEYSRRLKYLVTFIAKDRETWTMKTNMP